MHYPLTSSFIFMITDFAIDLRVARRKAGLTQTDCAQLLDISTSSISMLEHGKRLPTLFEICSLSLIYGRSFESLFAEIIASARLALQDRLRTLPAKVRHCAATFNRESTLKRLEERLLAEVGDHAA
ncbi:MAG: helix-turn-helix transcriptional regulator [Beijerinckiaceae bacterium]